MDGCGGFLLLDGNRWTVGGVAPQSPPDICVRADWPRRAGTIVRQGADYFWQPWQTEELQFIPPGNTLPTGGSAAMTLSCPSPLSNSATLALGAPHRMNEHVDGAILVDQTVLMGDNADCHIRTSEFPDRIVMVARDGRWRAKLHDQDVWCELIPNERITLGSLAMTLEPT